MNISATCLLISLLASVTASALGAASVFDLDFTRSAKETLKKLDINDACIISVSNPAAFTFCRKGSSTLWKYQALDLEQQAAIQIGHKRSSTDYQRITIVQLNSVACEQEHLAALAKPAIRRGLVLGLITLFLLVSLGYTYRAIRYGYYDQAGHSKPDLQQSSEFQLPQNSTVMALVAWGMAAITAFIYFGF
ncbi:hypothetical protein QMK54_20985 [Pseudomonas sp. P5_109]|uniref:hypothetical protein n=1 Tax=Pseudomonas sp. P5_109 TaxID=3043441 RepID=UPI002A358D61|nr:hypothetical protein [Pseudomonas sp. P5_109]WPN28297.1 hypothetical protein QMK54_20985 [Pseudomonas sp. P5_109]